MYKKYFKRLFDIIFSLLAFIALFPVFVLLTFVGFAVLKGNPFFIQYRPGKDERLIPIIKFRTMTNNVNDEGVLLHDDIRITRYGKFLRSTSLDEIPELINILKGDMSFVGPRPLLEEYLPFYNEYEHRRHQIRPGLTGLAQINGRNMIGWERKFEYDIFYIENMNFILDMKILSLTIVKVFSRSDVKVGSQIPAGRFDDYRRNLKQEP